MKHTLEKISILSLSLMLVSTFAVSPALPQMIAYFKGQGISQSQVELLMTVSSFSIMGTLLLNDRLARFLSEKTIIVSGLLCLALGGSMPFLFASYPLVFVSRVLLGLGIGLINARAIQIIGSHYEGKERTSMLGLRGSAEVLGSASLTALVGLLLGFGWQAAFLIYLFALVILVLYLLFVPQTPTPVVAEKISAKLDSAHWKMSLGLAGLAYVVIVINTALTLRIPLLVTVSGMGTAQQASVVLSLMQLMGIVAGVAFGHLVHLIKGKLMGLSYILLAGATFAVGASQSLLFLGAAAMALGFVYSIILTLVFHGVTERSRADVASQTMTIVLLGCNIGGATSSLVPGFLDKAVPSLGAMGIFAGVSLLLGVALLVARKRR